MYLCVFISKTWFISWNRLFRGICTCQWILTVSAVITATAWFISHTSRSQYGMIWWPDHGPRVDVEEFAPGSWRIGSVTCAFREARQLLACHWKRNGTSVTDGYQRQAAQNTSDRHYPHPRLRSWHIKHLCPDVSRASPYTCVYNRIYMYTHVYTHIHVYTIEYKSIQTNTKFCT